MKVIVIKEFRDVSSFKLIHKVGDVLEVEKERADRLVSLELVETKETKSPKEEKEVKISLFEKEFDKKVLVEALKSIGEKGAMNMKEETLIANVTALDEESTARLKEILGIEA